MEEFKGTHYMKLEVFAENDGTSEVTKFSQNHAITGNGRFIVTAIQLAMIKTPELEQVLTAAVFNFPQVRKYLEEELKQGGVQKVI